MRRNFKKNFAIFILFSVIGFVTYKFYFENGEEHDTFIYDASLVNTSINSINLGLDFFSNVEEGDLVFDVLIGIRIVVEQTWLLYKYLARKGGLKRFLGTLNEVIDKSNKLFDNIFDVLMRTKEKEMNGKNVCIFPVNVLNKTYFRNWPHSYNVFMVSLDSGLFMCEC